MPALCQCQHQNPPSLRVKQDAIADPAADAGDSAAWDCVTSEIITTSQALQQAGKNHVFEALVEIETKSQTWQVAWQHYLFQVPNEISTQSQAEQNAWEDDSFEALVELRSKSQTL